jgi:Recombination endonuclease VII
MATTYLNSAGNRRWKANWRDADGKQHSKNFDDQGSAEAYEVQMIAEREAAIANPVCARPGCNEPVVQTLVAGRLKGKRRKYHNEECERLMSNDSAARSKRRERAATPRVPRDALVCKLEECDNIVPDNPIGRPSEFCCREHGRIFHNRQQSRARGPNQRHRITRADAATQTGTCSVCGPYVPIIAFQDKYADGRPRTRFRCKTAAIVGSDGSRRAYNHSRLAWAAKLRAKYQMSIEEWDDLLIRQSGRCGKCLRIMLSPHVDHDHRAKRVRGLLCCTCNTGIGKLGDTREGLLEALAYLDNPATE